MSEFGGLRKDKRTQHACVGLGSADLAVAVALSRRQHMPTLCSLFCLVQIKQAEPLVCFDQNIRYKRDSKITLNCILSAFLRYQFIQYDKVNVLRPIVT